MSGDSKSKQNPSADDTPSPSSRQYILNKYKEICNLESGLELTYRKIMARSLQFVKDENLTKFHAYKSYDRNRYRDVLAYDHSRVRLMDPVENSDYINASYIYAPDACRKYISTQGPLPNTAEHFWQMIYEQNTYAIIMVTKCKENNMIKVFPYYPTLNPDDSKFPSIEQLQFGRFRITLLSEDKGERYISRRIRLDVLTKSVNVNAAKPKQGQWSSSSSDEEDDAESSSDNSENIPIDSPSKRPRKANVDSKMEAENEAATTDNDQGLEIIDSREIRHYQFIDWHDYKTPGDLDSLLHFLTEVRKSGMLNANEYGPPVVHCSAGIGRTGTFILVDATLAMLAKSDSWKSEEIDPNEQLLRYRQSRVGLVQTPSQLNFAWMCICEAIQHENTKWKELMALSNIHDPGELGQPPMLRSSGAVKTDGNLCTSMDDSMFDNRRLSSTSIDRRSTISSQPKWLETGTPEGQTIYFTNKSRPPESAATEHTKSKLKSDGQDMTFCKRRGSAPGEQTPTSSGLTVDSNSVRIRRIATGDLSESSVRHNVFASKDDENGIDDTLDDLSADSNSINNLHPRILEQNTNILISNDEENAAEISNPDQNARTSMIISAVQHRQAQARRRDKVAAMRNQLRASEQRQQRRLSCRFLLAAGVFASLSLFVFSVYRYFTIADDDKFIRLQAPFDSPKPHIEEL